MNIGYIYISLIVIGCIVGLALLGFLVELIFTTRALRKESIPTIHRALRTGKVMYIDGGEVEIIGEDRSKNNGKSKLGKRRGQSTRPLHTIQQGTQFRA